LKINLIAFFLIKRAACANKRFDIVKFLIEKGNADVNATDKKGDTCLTYASKLIKATFLNSRKMYLIV
jgi:ankyrin repeat protein